MSRMLGLPLEWAIHPGWVPGSHVLGLGLFSFLAVEWKSADVRKYLWIALSILAGVLIAGQVTARFVLESYFLAGAAVAVSHWNFRKRILRSILSIQALVVLAMAVYAAFLLFPSNFGESFRNETMHKVAHNYSVSRWLDDVLPENVILLSRIRSNAILPRPSRSSNVMQYRKTADQLALIQDLYSSGKDVVLVEYVTQFPGLSRLPDCAFEVIAGPRKFELATRNPLNRRGNSQFSLIVLRYVGQCSRRVQGVINPDN